MTPPHSAAPLDVIVETFPSEAWDSSACAVAREPVKALEQEEVVVVVAIRRGGVGVRVCGWKELLLLQHPHGIRLWRYTGHRVLFVLSRVTKGEKEQERKKRFAFKVSLIKTPSCNSVCGAQYMG